MTYEEIVKNLKDKAQNSQFDEILDNFKLYNCKPNITRFPIKTLKEKYINSKIKDNYDIINEMKKNMLNFSKRTVLIVILNINFLMINLEHVMIMMN